MKQSLSKQKPVVVALGGNAIENCGRHGTSRALEEACTALADLAEGGLLISHGNGPQIGFLDEQQNEKSERLPLDILGAETEGWLGYEIERMLRNKLAGQQSIVSVLTCMEIDRSDSAIDKPDKPIGRWMDEKSAREMQDRFDWQFTESQRGLRRVVPSPTPIACLQSQAIKELLATGHVVICAGGGGIPVCRDQSGELQGLEGVIDKDRASALIASEVEARSLILATNVAGVYRHWPADESDPEQLLHETTVDELDELDLETGSMLPKVEAAIDFVRTKNRPAVIGHLQELEELTRLQSGTVIRPGQI